MPRVGSSSTSTSTPWWGARDRDLLLVAARELADRLIGSAAFDAEARDPVRRGAPLTAGHDERGRTERLEPREREVVGHAEPEREPLVLAVFAEKAHAGAPARARRRGAAAGVRADADPAAPNGFETEERAQESRAAGAHESRNTEDLASVQRERRGARLESLDVEERGARLPRAAREEIRRLPADHQRDDAVGRRFRRRAAATLHLARTT